MNGFALWSIVCYAEVYNKHTQFCAQFKQHAWLNQGLLEKHSAVSDRDRSNMMIDSCV